MNELIRPIARRMTYDEFAVWDAPSQCRWQLIEGEAIEMAPTSRRHGVIQAELVRLLGNHFVATGSDLYGVIEPGVVPLARPDINYRIPDVAVTSEPDDDSQTVQRPVVLIEVLSPSNEAHTRLNVMAFKTIPSVQEILLIRPTRIEVELHRRGPDDIWPADPTIIVTGGTLSLSSIGFSTPVSAIYRATNLQR